jgi:chemotaxis methyl-accepting protein methylase
MLIRGIIETVQRKSGQDLSVYSASFLKKTLALRMRETASGGLAGYLNLIEKEPEELLCLNNSLHISYTLFFRNVIDFALFENFVFPEIVTVKEKKASHTIRMWSAGCADGPEAYSLAMIADKVISDRKLRSSVMVFGTDVSSANIEKARAGVYNRDPLQNVKLSYLERYFTAKKSQFAVNEKIRNQVDFFCGDLIDPEFSSPPAAIFADFDIIACCNMMIYYNEAIQQVILKKLYRSLSPDGYLMVGESERLIVEKFGRFRPLFPMGNIFKKNQAHFVHPSSV